MASEVAACEDCGRVEPDVDTAWNSGWLAFEEGPHVCPGCVERRNAAAKGEPSAADLEAARAGERYTLEQD